MFSRSVISKRSAQGAEGDWRPVGRALPGRVAIFLAFTLFLPFSASANPPGDVELTPDQLREASSIFEETWSPFCPGRTLSSCTSGKAAAWRQDVRTWMAQGLSKEEIMDRLQNRVPGFSLSTIPTSGGTKYGPWVLGGGFILALLGLAYFQGRQASARPVPLKDSAPDRSNQKDADVRALRAELEALED